MFRKANSDDINSIAKIYKKILEQEEKQITHIGWLPNVYPIKYTAISALNRNDLFVYEENGKILASGIINHIQPEAYIKGNWKYTADNNEIMVLHTLVVSPEYVKSGIGKKFVKYYEEYALEQGCSLLRIDTNKKNTVARSFYNKLGYEEIGIVDCNFNGIPNVNLVLLEKKISDF